MRGQGRGFTVLIFQSLQPSVVTLCPAVGEEARQAAGRRGRRSAPRATVRAGHVSGHRHSRALVLAKRLCDIITDILRSAH